MGRPWWKAARGEGLRRAAGERDENEISSDAAPGRPLVVAAATTARKWSGVGEGPEGSLTLGRQEQRELGGVGTPRTTSSSLVLAISLCPPIVSLLLRRPASNITIRRSLHRRRACLLLCLDVVFFLLGPTCFCSTGSLRYRPSTISTVRYRARLSTARPATWHRAHRWSANPAIVSISACLRRVLDSLSRVPTVPAHTPRFP